VSPCVSFFRLSGARGPRKSANGSARSGQGEASRRKIAHRRADPRVRPPSDGSGTKTHPGVSRSRAREENDRASERATKRRKVHTCACVRVCVRVCSSLAASTGIGNDGRGGTEERRPAVSFVRAAVWRSCFRVRLLWHRFSRVSASRRGNDEPTNTIHSGGWSVGRFYERSTKSEREREGEGARERGR